MDFDNILNGFNNIAPPELNRLAIQSFYYDIAPTEQMKNAKKLPVGQLHNRN